VPPRASLFGVLSCAVVVIGFFRHARTQDLCGLMIFGRRASLLIDTGASPNDFQALETTMRWYAWIHPGRSEDLATRLNDPIAEVRKGLGPDAAMAARLTSRASGGRCPRQRGVRRRPGRRSP
jgi:hypothetical protein